MPPDQIAKSRPLGGAGGIFFRGTSYLALIMRLGGVYETRGDSVGRNAPAVIEWQEPDIACGRLLIFYGLYILDI